MRPEDPDLATLTEGVDAADLAQVADSLRAVVADLDDGALRATVATRRRLEGAAVALDVLAGRRSRA